MCRTSLLENINILYNLVKFNLMDKQEDLQLLKSHMDQEHEKRTCGSFIQNFTNSDLEKLRTIFKSRVDEDNREIGLDRNEFLNAISRLHDDSTYLIEGEALFNEIIETTKEALTWNTFLDFLITKLYPNQMNKVKLDLISIENVAHTKSESVAKIVLLETHKYFCYAIILKYGRVGLYDGNLNFLTSYHAIFTREDISRPEGERRRRNRWITDALFCPDTLLFVMTNTARTVIIYEASGLKHIPLWLLISTPNIIEVLVYKPYEKSDIESQSALFAGDCFGNITSFTFHQARTTLLRKKRKDELTLFYWEDFLKENDYVTVKTYGKVHESAVRRAEYIREYNVLITCSDDQNSSIAVKYLNNKRESVYYKIPKGASCFCLSVPHNTLITGSRNGVIRLWNFLISKPISVIAHCQTNIVDLRVLDKQELFISCSYEGDLNVWDLKEYSCLQTIKLTFPSFHIHGKLIEWGINSIYPGPKRQPPEMQCDSGSKKECFGINDIDEKKIENLNKTPSENFSIWERSNLLVTCCNHIGKLRMSFEDASVEYSFTYPVLPPPPLQNSVLIPTNWGLQNYITDSKQLSEELNINVEKQLEELSFILDKNMREEEGRKNNINYKIAILESKKEQMRAHVAMGAPYLALDVHEIEELRLSETVLKSNRKKRNFYIGQIQELLDNASNKDEIFSSSSSNRSKSNKCSIVEFPL